MKTLAAGIVGVDVQLTDIFTKSLCSEIIVEIVKFIIYQKQLIPYPLERLKLCTSKKINAENSNLSPTSSTKGSYLVEKHFKKTMASLDILDNVFKDITYEIENCDQNDLKEVLLLLGATTLSPQNVFRIKIPSIDNEHLEKHHPSKKQLVNVIRSLLGTTPFTDLMCQEINTKNLFVFLKLNSSYSVKSSYLIPKDNFRFPVKTKEATINILSNNKNISNCCCKGVNIFHDSFLNSSDSPVIPSSSESISQTEVDCDSDLGLTTWYQFKSPFIGFKDEKVNGVSVTDMWLKSV